MKKIDIFTDELKKKILDFLYADEMYNAILIELIENNIDALGELYINEMDEKITEILHIKDDGNSNFTSFIYSSEKGLKDIAYKIKELDYKKVLLSGKLENVKSLLSILDVHKDIESNIFYKLDFEKFKKKHIKYQGRIRLASSNSKDLETVKYFTSQFLEAETKEEIEAVTDTEKTLAKIKSGVYILEYENNSIGMARFIGKTDNFAEITSVYIDKAYRSKGFGKELIAHMIETAIKQQKIPILATSIFNISAIKTYESIGFERQREYAYEFLN